MPEKRYLVMLNVHVDGSYTPITFQRENLDQTKAIIVIDDITEVVWVWIGANVSVVQRSIASRASNYIAKYGYMIDEYKIGAGFTRRLIEEQFLEDLETQDTYDDFFHLFNKDKSRYKDYYTVEIEDSVRGNILEKEEFQQAKETMQNWLEEALLVIDGLEEIGVASEDYPKHVQASLTAPDRHAIKGEVVLGVSSAGHKESSETTSITKLSEEQRELRDGIVFAALLKLNPEGYVGRIVESDQSRTFMLVNEEGDLIATVRVKFDDTGRIQIDTYDFNSAEYESIFLRKFGELTASVI